MKQIICTLLGRVGAILCLAMPLTLAAQSTFNPGAPALGFNVFTSGNVTVVGGDTHGPVAAGGNLILAGNAPLVMNTSGTYPTNILNSSSNYGLVIGGRCSITAAGVPPM